MGTKLIERLRAGARVQKNLFECIDTMTKEMLRCGQWKTGADFQRWIGGLWYRYPSWMATMGGAGKGILAVRRFVLNLRSFLLVALLSAVGASAQVTLPRVLSSHMVVQRDLPVHVWGMVDTGRRGERRVSAARRARPAPDRWGGGAFISKPGAAGGPFALTVTGTPANGAAQTVTLDDVLVGDVWVASGQSNMEFAMRQAATAEQDLPHAGNAQIRLLMVKKKAVDYPLDDVETEGWTVSTPETAKRFFRGGVVLCAGD